MKRKAFIIALTGPSACGKSYITEKMIELGDKLRYEGIDFRPIRFSKYVTRKYRETEVIYKNRGEVIDVESVRSIPSGKDGCELVYRTYGEEYGIRKKDLIEKLGKNESPIVVINDVRVVEELKKEFKGRVLSLFIFREIIPDPETHENAGRARGAGPKSNSQTRFEKAVALYRVFIENIFIFDRVILNVKYEGKNKDGKEFENLADIQTENIIRGVIEKKISLNKKIKKSPKLFIISGNAASGKDDIIKAANRIGQLQTDILKKYTTRWQEFEDENEIICQYIPNNSLISRYNEEFDSELSNFNKENTFEHYKQMYWESCKSAYEKKDEAFKNCYTLDEFCSALYSLKMIEGRNSIKTGIDRFWEAVKREQENRSEKSTNKLSEKEYLFIRDEYFELNPDYLDLNSIESRHLDEIELETSKIADKSENPSYLLHHEGKDYILYQNNILFNNPVNYGFEIKEIKEKWKQRKKHIVLTASLPNIFSICKEYFGEENVITAFTYSQITEKQHLDHSDIVMGQAKLREYGDILRYANHIVEFDYALIYAETSKINKEGSQKDELVDQMFRLFRTFNRKNWQ
ncbi:MAG: hypothetical protein ACM3SY_15620 [Candidatus Omnitrophota bacterium]